jgi:hypothetical protein
LTLFERVQLLQPTFSVPAPASEAAQRLGWAEIQRPLDVAFDAPRAKAFLAECQRLVGIHRYSGYLDRLKHAGDPAPEGGAGGGLVREIRQYGRGRGDSREEQRLRGQLLLHLAQVLAGQRREILDALRGLREQERALLLHLGPDRDDDELWAWDKGSLPNPEADDFLIPQRLRAWGEMRAAARGPVSPVLLTDHGPAMEWLRSTACDGDGDPARSCWVILRIPVPRFSPADLGETGRIRRAIFSRLTWGIFCERVEALVAEAGRGPGAEAGLTGLAARGRALAAYFRDAVLGDVLEAVTALEPSWGEGWREEALGLFLFPGRSEESLLAGSPRESSPHPEGPPALVFCLEAGRGLF